MRKYFMPVASIILAITVLGSFGMSIYAEASCSKIASPRRGTPDGTWDKCYAEDPVTGNLIRIK